MLSYVECVKLVENTYYVAFSMSTCLLSGGACGLDLISPNQMCNALLTLGRMIHDFSLYQGLFLHPPYPLTLLSASSM